MHLVIPLVVAIVLMALAARRLGRRKQAAADRPPVRAGVVHTSGRHVPFGCGSPDDPHVDRRMAVIRRPSRPDYIRAVQPTESRERTCHACYLETGLEKPEKKIG